VRVIQAFILVLGVIVCGLILLSPLALDTVPWSSEIWLFQTIQDMHKGLHLVPELNGLPLVGQNPVNIILLSLSPWSDMFSLRLISILMGCAVAACVCIFSMNLWDMKTAAISTLITLTSLGFILTYSTLNTAIIPGSMCILAFLLFSLVYLKGLNSLWYILSYILLCISTITGGWSVLAFFAFSSILLILLDLSPRNILKIRALFGIILVAVALGCVYLTYRIAGGSVFASALFAQDNSPGFFGRIWIFIKSTLPWLPLVLPAWIYSEASSQGKDAWRSLLPIKIAFVMGAAILLFSPDYNKAYALLSVPFASMLIGNWVALGLGSPRKVVFIKGASFILTGLIIMGSGMVVLSIQPIKALSLNMMEAIPILGFLIATLVFVWLVKKRSHTQLITLYICAVFVLVWSIALIQLPGKASMPLPSIKDMTSYSPLLVYRDDLVMRGYIEYAGIKPIIVEPKIVPIAESVYLASSSPDLDDLLEELNSRMYANLVTSYDDVGSFALIKLSPLAGIQ
jgi:hypothetical protein